jgi:hypothetical protein
MVITTKRGEAGVGGGHAHARAHATGWWGWAAGVLRCMHVGDGNNNPGGGRAMGITTRCGEAGVGGGHPHARVRP